MKKKNNIKEDIANVKHYLIENFYCNPDNRYTIKMINKNTNINIDTIKLVIGMLKRKKLIKNNYEFKLTLESIEFLENDFKYFKSNLLSAISISIAVFSLSISVFINKDILHLLVFVLVLIFFIMLFYFGRKL